MISYSGAHFFTADHYHHHIATNTWIGTNILPVSDNDSKPGVDHYAVRLSNNKEKKEMKKKLKNRFTSLGISINETILDSDMQYLFN